MFAKCEGSKRLKANATDSCHIVTSVILGSATSFTCPFLLRFLLKYDFVQIKEGISTNSPQNLT